MNFLKKLATPFIAIWRWIKETAWVQPLLIVGIIFGVIFSIPSITQAIQSIDFGSDKYTWLKEKNLSLEGMTDAEQKGAAHDFFVSFNKANSAWDQDKKDEARNELKKYTGDSNKMFFYFVQEDTNAENINEASSYLVKDGWKSKVVEKAQLQYKGEGEAEKHTQPFAYRSIFVDQEVKVDENNHVYDEYKPFDYLAISPEFAKFTTALHAAGIVSPYYKNLETSSEKSTYTSNLESVMKYDTIKNVAPFIVMIDLTDVNTTSNIITNVFFGVPGETKYERADFLANAWIGAKEFEL